ncbi:MAG TPA: TonB-dependent receptor, partial [Pyrinomonadaceae bacterium]|nr:TonB-dependent receptor [Pyrinomonadaceae bacterium]
ATSVERGDTREVTSSDEGVFVMPELKAGLYQVAVEVAGFRRTNVDNVKVDVQGIQSLEIKLEIGEVTGNTVTVNAEAVSINADSPVRQTNVNERQVRELPLLTGGESEGRSPLSFIFLDSNVSSAAQDGNNNTSKFRVSGGQASGTEILIDGAAVRRQQNGTFFSEIAPSPNAFQEFTISTNSFSAEFGNSSGGVVNFTLRSGGNDFHGEAYNYLRNEVLNANRIDNIVNGQPRNRDNRNNYGFNISGPIYVPNFGEGNEGGIFRSLRDRAFFFFHYEGYRLRIGQNALLTVPTVRMRNGDFSELLNTSDPNVARINGGQPILIYDPRQPSATRQAFAGNIIPQSSIDPAGLAILQRFPLPTRAGIFQNYDAQGLRPTDTNQYTIKTDFVLTSKQRLSVSYSRRDTERLAGAFPLLPLPFTNFDVFAQDFKSNIARIQHDYSITSNLLNHFNLGYTFLDVANRNTTDPFDTSSLGIPVGATQNSAFPRINFPGYGGNDARNVTNIGSSFFTDQIRDGVLQLSDFVTFVTGRSTYKFGADVRISQFNVRQKIDPGGSFNFRNDQTASDQCGNCGYPIASLITGATEFAFNSNNSIDPAFRQLTQGYFIQDDIKVNQKLTLNVGLRYDLPGLRTEARDRFRGFDPEALNTAIGRRGALVGAGGQSGLQAEERSLSRSDKSNIGPRLGAAYAFDSKTVVRGGIGLYYAPILYGTGGNGDINTGTIGFNTTGQLFTPNGRNARNFLSTFPSIPRTDPNNQFVGDLGIPILAFGQFGNGFRTGRTLQYTVDVQRELPYRLIASVGYIGHRADRLRSNFGRPNALTLDQLRLGNEILRTNINAVTAEQRAFASTLGITLPANRNAVYPGFANGCDDVNNRDQRCIVAQALRPFPQYGRVTDILESEGESNYNALQIKLDRRFAQGFQFGASYTFSRLITNASDDILGGSPLDGVIQNPYDLSSLKTVSPSNSPHVFVTNFLAELPFGKGKSFLNYGGTVGGIVDRIFGGFQVSGIFRIQQGTPLVFSLDPSNQGDNGLLELAGIFGRLRPNLTGQPIAASQRVDVPGVPGRALILNPGAFAAPPSFNSGAPPFLLANGQRNPAYAAFYADPTRFFGTAPLVNEDFRSDRFFTADMSILKKTRITETVTLELGAEFFNVFNQTLFLPPDTFLGRQEGSTGGINLNRNFGVEGFTSRLGEAGNRVIQLRARLFF